jgi:predicted SpoU family rRNA methylase
MLLVVHGPYSVPHNDAFGSLLQHWHFLVCGGEEVHVCCYGIMVIGLVP